MGNTVDKIVTYKHDVFEQIRNNFSLKDLKTRINDYAEKNSDLALSSPSLPYPSERKKNTSEETPKKKPGPCCVCKETKQARDTCIVENGEENCSSLIEAHKKCLRDNGFQT